MEGRSERLEEWEGEGGEGKRGRGYWLAWMLGGGIEERERERERKKKKFI